MSSSGIPPDLQRRRGAIDQQHHIGTSAAGAVAAGHEEVARVGALVLEEGGNAVDAVVAMVVAGCVCEGTLTSLGGGGFMVVAGGEVDDPVLLDFFVHQPGLEPRPWLAPWDVHALELDGAVLRYGTGPASVAVPGMPRGLAHASRRFGRRSFAELCAPGAQLAQDGVLLTRTQAGEHAANAALLGSSADGAAVYLLGDGTTRGPGALFRQPQLAAAIEELAASDGDSMYEGDMARRLLAWSDERGGRISATDLVAYDVRERVPLAFAAGDVRMFANPAPSMGGAIIVRLLEAMLDEVHSVERAGEPRDLRVGRALVRVLAEMDPPRTVPPARGEPVTEAPPPQRLHDAVADALGDRGMVSPTRGDDAGDLSRSPNTTHVSAIDGDGMMCGATTTLGYGAGEFVPGTDIQLNNMLAEYGHTRTRPPGSVVPSMMTPAVLVSPRTKVQLGSAGSDRIPHAMSQILLHMWDGEPLETAIHAPRFSFDGQVLHAEPGIDERALDQLAEVHEVRRWNVADAYFGTSNGTALRGGSFHAAGDPRREAIGLVAG